MSSVKMSVFGLAAVSFLFACSNGSAPPSDQQSTAGAQTGGTKSSDGTSKAPSSTSPSSTSGHALDGTWDITSIGGTALAPSQMTVKGGQFDGVLVVSDEGTRDVDGCMITKDRIAFTATVSGDSLSLTLTPDLEVSGDDCTMSTGRQVAKLSATRTHNAKNASGQTALEGDWVVTPDNDSATPFAVSVAGLVAKAWDNASKDRNPVLSLNAANGTATTTTSNSDLSFAARKR
jgi:hypothetical protein